MKTFLVGGAVRDQLLGLEVKERDWVVVGATPEDMVRSGYRSVGRDFPVFVHPDTGEEYALARTERKVGPGYHGFVFHTSPDVSLEADLRRRDLTINAIAQGADGHLIDPFRGQADLDSRVLRHVSPAFAEDPVRILRVARFAARFHTLGFSVAAETMSLMREMVGQGEVDALVPERVWQELYRALTTDSPDVFVQVLRDCGALARVLPEVDALFGVPQPLKYHPERDTGQHVLLALQLAGKLQLPPSVCFAVLVHDVGKGVTPTDLLPSHRGHEAKGVPLVKAICGRLRVPRAFRELALLVTREHLHVHRVREQRPATVINLLDRLDAWRRPERFDLVLWACECDARGRGGQEHRNYPSAEYLRAIREVTGKVRVDTDGLKGVEIGRRLYEARVDAIKEYLKLGVSYSGQN